MNEVEDSHSKSQSVVGGKDSYESLKNLDLSAGSFFACLAHGGLSFSFFI